MSRQEKPTKTQFLKEHVVPVLFIFLIPAFSLWFFRYAEDRLDGAMMQQIRADVKAEASLPDEEKRRILSFYENEPLSKLMASDDPELAELQKGFAPISSRYSIFRWMKRIAWICLLTALFTFVIVGGSVWYSLRSQSALYCALRVGWPVLKTSAAIQVLGQAILACALSFWVTAILTESYYVKLIILAGVLALGAVLALYKAIFAKVNDGFSVEGVLLPEADGAALRQQIGEMAESLQTATPDHIILGIDSNFFVTEHPVTLNGRVLEGRTLFLSLPMLKMLSVDEANAVLGHELAHFSGDDTLWSRRISPLTGKFALYLVSLQNGLSLIVGRFMHLFWKLYHLSINRQSRAREFRADTVGATMTSRDALKRALVKVTGYCEYRDKTEQGILSRRKVDHELKLSRVLEEGFPAFLSSFTANPAGLGERVAHPFDSHPTLSSRLAHLGFQESDVAADRGIQPTAEASWHAAIPSAAVLEEGLWAARESSFRDFHGQDLAWRLMPRNAEEIAIVEEHFPRATFQKTKGQGSASLSFEDFHISGWESPILFKDIMNLELERLGWPKNRLMITHWSPRLKKNTKTKCYPSQYVNAQGDLLAAFSAYYTRFKTAQERSARTRH